MRWYELEIVISWREEGTGVSVVEAMKLTKYRRSSIPQTPQ